MHEDVEREKNRNAKAWDDEFEKDALSGKFDRLAKQAIKDFRDGKCRALFDK